MQLLKNFLDFAVTPYHAVNALQKIFEDAGFQKAEGTLEPLKKYFIVRGGTSICAFRLPASVTDQTTFRIATAHSDFPGFRLTPNADRNDASGHLLHSEVYGSPILSSWFDRDLGIAGNIVTEDLQSVLFADDSLCRIPNLAIHLTRGKAEPKPINTQTEMNALCDFEETLEQHLAHIAGKKFLSFDARFFDRAPAQISASGSNASKLISCGRLDNLLAALAAARALANCNDTKNIAVACIFDHEEIGSKSREGAGGNFLQGSLEYIANAVGMPHAELFDRYAKSFMLSMDAAHAVHPNHLEAHDPQNMPKLGGGSVVKVNAQKRYATDIYSEAYFRKIAKDIPLQTFVSRNDMPCGSTVGPTLSASLGIPTVDIGVPLLSMHSIRETANFGDFLNHQLCAKAVFESNEPYPFA